MTSGCQLPARRVLAKAEHDQFSSVAAAWEMAIKSSLGNLKLPLPIGRLVEEQLPSNRIELLPVSFADLAHVELLPFHHHDPFDRMMAAQAIERSLTIVSVDPIFEKYGIRRIW